jgi:response regulator of citrate/malate metabolism
MKFNEEEMRIIWQAIADYADNQEDMEGTDGYDQSKIDATRALANRFDARYAEPP